MVWEPGKQRTYSNLAYCAGIFPPPHTYTHTPHTHARTHARTCAHTHTHTHTNTHPQVSKFSTTILSAMLAGMDDREDPEDLITMEAMSGLARIFEQIDEGHVRPILINIALRIRPCFEKVALIDHAALRMWYWFEVSCMLCSVTYMILIEVFWSHSDISDQCDCDLFHLMVDFLGLNCYLSLPFYLPFTLISSLANSSCACCSVYLIW